MKLPIRERVKDRVTQWLRQGMSPRRLALTLALGFAIGCIPVVGLPTLVCAAVALALGLNVPAIQAANYVAMPLQLALIVPFVRLGGRMTAAAPRPNAVSLLRLSPLHMATQLSGLAGQALLAWLLVAIPAVLLITVALTPMLRRVPVLAAAESGD
ncbi:MAG: DUF2062 domain-containing protein [Terracidiphilus sp.]